MFTSIGEVVIISLFVCSHKNSSWIFVIVLGRLGCLQCFDTVGWAAGRASGL